MPRPRSCRLPRGPARRRCADKSIANPAGCVARPREDDRMGVIPPDYDADPGRWRSHDRSWLVDGDVHEVVAERVAAEGLAPVLDVGCGNGRLAELLEARSGCIGL